MPRQVREKENENRRKLKDIAAELNVSNGTISHLRKQYGIENGGYKERGKTNVEME